MWVGPAVTPAQLGDVTMMIMPCDCEHEKTPAEPQLKDGLSERKPLFDGWVDTRVSQTPRTRHIEPHNKEMKEDGY